MFTIYEPHQLRRLFATELVGLLIVHKDHAGVVGGLELLDGLFLRHKCHESLAVTEVDAGLVHGLCFLMVHVNAFSVRFTLDEGGNSHHVLRGPRPADAQVHLVVEGAGLHLDHLTLTLAFEGVLLQTELRLHGLLGWAQDGQLVVGPLLRGRLRAHHRTAAGVAGNLIGARLRRLRQLEEATALLDDN